MIFKSAAFSDLSDTVIVSRAITPLIYDASFLMPESSPANTIRIFLSAAIGLEPNTGAVDISFFLFFFYLPLLPDPYESGNTWDKSSILLCYPPRDLLTGGWMHSCCVHNDLNVDVSCGQDLVNDGFQSSIITGLVLLVYQIIIKLPFSLQRWKWYRCCSQRLQLTRTQLLQVPSIALLWMQFGSRNAGGSVPSLLGAFAYFSPWRFPSFQVLFIVSTVKFSSFYWGPTNPS